jgi:putative ABC transport system permease protein
MARPRWVKLWRDVMTERGRVLLMIASIVVSLSAVGAMLGAYGVLTREVAVNYLGTRPASATLELPGGVDAALVAKVRERPEIAEAEARDAVLARVRVGQDWRPLLLFVIDDFEHLRLNRFRPQEGSWPPPEGTLLLERSAVGMVEAGPGQTITVRVPGARAEAVPISGTVHDPGLAPAWQERMGYAYTTRSTLARLGGSPVLHELRIEVRDKASDRAAIEAVAGSLARWLGGRGREVHEIRVPPPKRHPHQLQMVTVLVMLTSFAVLSLVLSAVVVASNLAAMLARQVREIGVMKTVGASRSQIAGLYLVFVAALAGAAVLVAAPLGVAGARLFAGAIARMLNFELTSQSVPSHLLLIQAAAGLLVPLGLAALPIRRASRTTIRETLDQHGASGEGLRDWSARLPVPLRHALRRPARLGLTLLLLAAGGAMFMTALNLRASWIENLDKFYEARHYDLELRFQRPEGAALLDALRRIPGVRSVEAWGYSPTSFSRAGEVDVSHAYPDGGHGTFNLMGVPPATELVTFPVMEGRWLRASDRDAVVLNHGVRARAPGLKLGDEVTLSLEGRPTRWTIAGFVEEIGSMPAAYVTDRAFADAAGHGDATRLVRLATSATSPEQRTEILRAVEAALLSSNAALEQALPLAEHRTAIGDHLVILVRALVALAAVMAVVGALGLASAMGVSVIERTRELAVMKTIGATPRRILRDLLAEGLFVGAMSWVFACILSLPLTLYLDRLIGGLGFLASLPFVVVPGAALGWLALVGAVAILATALPARRAAGMTIREALAQT